MSERRARYSSLEFYVNFQGIYISFLSVWQSACLIPSVWVILIFSIHKSFNVTFKEILFCFLFYYYPLANLLRRENSIASVCLCVFVCVCVSGFLWTAKKTKQHQTFHKCSSLGEGEPYWFSGSKFKVNVDLGQGMLRFCLSFIFDYSIRSIAFWIWLIFWGCFLNRG